MNSLELLQHDNHLLKGRVQQLKLELAEKDRVLKLIETEIQRLKKEN